jgi:hypothetical protein
MKHPALAESMSRNDDTAHGPDFPAASAEMV